MSIAVCAISGAPLVQGMVSKKTGHLFEKSTILKHLNTFPYCPITNTPLSVEDLVEIKGTNTQISSNTTSVPTLTQKLQQEYDNIVLESYYLKKHLTETREELSHALYQHDAAVRVIAKLIQERDEARQEIVNLNIKIQQQLKPSQE